MEAYQAFCDERGIGMLEATMGWFLAQPGIASIIAGATKPEQVRQNAEAGTAWTPTADEVETMSGFFPR
jgi:aryl-alcohol dehydrogenase-like predicted oxidoreductase